MAVTASAPASAEGLIPNVAPGIPGGCQDVRVSRSTFHGAETMLNWRENLVFDGHGRMWVSNYGAGRIEAYEPDGSLAAALPAPGPGGLALAPNGRVEVNTGIVLGGKGTVSSFDPVASRPALRVEIPDVAGHNGLAVDAQGNRYLTGEGSATVRKFRADGTADQAWTAAAAASGSNGAFVAGDRLVVSRLGDPASSIVSLGLTSPSPRTVTQLSPWLVNWKGLDDLTVVGEVAYVAGFASGEVLRVNLRTGANCVIANGLVMPTSVRSPVAFGASDPARDLFVTAADGAIHRLTVTPR